MTPRLYPVLARLLGLLALVGAAGSAPAADPAPARPARNILLVVADDLGTDLGCYGNASARTPHLDRLASEGIRFTHAFCTTASCSPSRSVLLSGLHNHATGQYGLAHDTHHFQSFDRIRSLPVRLTQAGYRTARIGKFHVLPEDTYRFGQVLTGFQGGDRNPMAMAERCRPFLAEASTQPFFLYFCTSDPHRSGQVNSNAPVRPAPNRFGNGPKYAGVVETPFDPAAVRVPAFLPDTPPVRAELAEYHQSVARFDQGIGRLLAVLEETGHRDDTLVVVLSDNGIAFPGAKTGLYEPGMRLPLLVRPPGGRPTPEVCDAMVSWVDLAPTLLDFAGVAAEAGAFHGRSFLPLLTGARPPGWDEVFASHTFHEVTMYYPMRVVRQRRFKLIHNLAHPLSYPFASDLWDSAAWQGTLLSHATTYGKRTVEAFLHRPEWELYDLDADPDEIRNLAGTPAHASTLSELQARLRTFQKTTRDPWQIKEQHE